VFPELRVRTCSHVNVIVPIVVMQEGERIVH